VPIYGSGGFCSYSNARLQEQMWTWVDMDIPRLKIKVAREPQRDPDRLRAVRAVMGDDRELFVDANGAYTRKQALAWAHRFHDEFGVSYLEEPVTSEDLEGLRLVRDHGPPGLAVAAGEYSWNLFYTNGLIEGGCVDIIQADVTRVGGVTEMLRVDGLAKARSMPSSAHCAPALSAHVSCAMETVAHIEYFHDHVRVEKLLFDGTLEPEGGYLEPNADRPGHGLALKLDDAAEYLVHDSRGS
jgi:L-alanine-DL-glutamate epimerase-like enolase superfamily enzyme